VCTRIGGLGFGDNCSIGDVSIGNVAGRDINYYSKITGVVKF